MTADGAPEAGGAYGEYRRFGRDYLGPFLYAYTDWLWEQLCASGIQKVFFFARDGYMMEKAFRLFEARKGGGMQAAYVYFSRKSIRQTLLWRCGDYEQSLQYMSTARFVTLGGILEYYGFAPAERERLARERGLDLGQEFRYAALTQERTLRDLYQSLKGEIDARSKAQDALLLRYVRQIGMEGHCAIVDIGWYGRMQNYLETYLAGHDLPVTVSGYYLGIYPLAPLHGAAKGYFYSGRDPAQRKRITCFLGGYEKLFQSLEGSAHGYQERDGRIEPVYGPYEYEGDQDACARIRAWQDGALAYIRQALDEGVPAERDLTGRLVRFGQYPPLWGVRLFGFFRNNDGSDDYYLSQKSLWKYRPRELMYALSNSTWKTGFMRSVFRAPLPYYYIYYWMTK